MATGDVTCAYVGRGLVGTAAFTAIITGLNQGTQGLSGTTVDIFILPTGAPGEFCVYKLTRSA